MKTMIPDTDTAEPPNTDATNMSSSSSSESRTSGTPPTLHRPLSPRRHASPIADNIHYATVHVPQSYDENGSSRPSWLSRMDQNSLTVPSSTSADKNRRPMAFPFSNAPFSWLTSPPMEPRVPLLQMFQPPSQPTSNFTPPQATPHRVHRRSLRRSHRRPLSINITVIVVDTAVRTELRTFSRYNTDAV